MIENLITFIINNLDLSKYLRKKTKTISIFLKIKLISWYYLIILDYILCNLIE